MAEVKKKVISVSINIDDPIGNSNEDTLLHILRNHYVGKCFANCFITSIERILRRGEFIINQGSGTHATVPFTIEVGMIYFLPGELITGCKVTHVDTQLKFITAEIDTAYIILPRTDILSSIRVGQYITCEVVDSKYKIGAERVSINAKFYFPRHVPTVYMLTGGNADTAGTASLDFTATRELQERCKLYEDLLTRENAKVLAIFKKLLTPVLKKPLMPHMKKKLSDELQPGSFVATSPDVLSGEYLQWTDKPPYQVVDMPADAASAQLWKNYYENLKALYNSIKLYDAAKIKSHANIWAILASGA